jgi:hypothetical protein
LPFLTLDIWNYRPEEEVQKAQAYDEPMAVMFLSDITGTSLEKKNKEIRDKLKASNSLIKLITINGFDEMLPREWIRQAIGVIYELICASLSHHYHHAV